MIVASRSNIEFVAYVSTVIVIFPLPVPDFGVTDAQLMSEDTSHFVFEVIVISLLPLSGAKVIFVSDNFNVGSSCPNVVIPTIETKARIKSLNLFSIL